MAKPEATLPLAEFLIDHRVWNSRLVREMELAVGISETLQNAIHDLHLHQVDRHSRAALQNADKLTQSLQCLAAALKGQTDPETPAVAVDIAHVGKTVFLEDVRRRLIDGPDASGHSPVPSGQVDFF